MSVGWVGFEQGRTVFDELLDAVGDIVVSVLVDSEHIACLEPAILGEGVLVQFGAVPVPVKDIRALDEELSSLIYESHG